MEHLPTELKAIVVRALHGSDLRRIAPVAVEWRGLVAAERRHRLALPRRQFALLGGRKPYLGNYMVLPGTVQVRVVGQRAPTGIPDLPVGLRDSNAVVMSDGSIVVSAEASKGWVFLRFDPIGWRWDYLPEMEASRARSNTTIVSTDGVGIVAVGGCSNVDGENACAFVDELVGDRWVSKQDLPVKVIDPTVVSFGGSTLLAFGRGDDDEIDEEAPMPFPGSSSEAFLEELPVSIVSGVSLLEVCNGVFVAATVGYKKGLVLFGCRPYGVWVGLGRIPNPGERMSPELDNPTLALVGTRLVVGVAFSDMEDESKVGWWGVAIEDARRAVCVDGVEAPVWENVTKLVGTPLRQCACIRLPVY